MQKKLKLLISAYACSPYHGSEPGMGWNFISRISKFHDIHVIVEKRKWQKPINKYLASNPSFKQNLTFHFIDKKRNKSLRKLWPPSYYWYYKNWQKKAYKLALKLDKKEKFDVIHQLNMVGYREPGFLWKIEKPFVWGPIGGLENSPWIFLPSLGLKGFIFYVGRNIFNLIQRNFSNRPKRASTRKNASIIAATPGNQDLIKKLWGINSHLICEVGQDSFDTKIVPKKRTSKNDPLKIIWSGEHIPRKYLSLLLKALEKVKIPFELHILGKGEMTKDWQKLAKKVNVSKFCHWYGWIERKNAVEIMSSCHVFCNTSISDLTATVTLEALTFGLPIVCLDHFGFADVVTNECGIKIAVNTPRKASENIANAIEKLYFEESFRQKLSKGAILRAEEFNWSKKIEQLNAIYKSLPY